VPHDVGALYTTGTSGIGPSGWFMGAGTSPSIAGSINGPYGAFQATNLELWTFITAIGGMDTGFASMAGTSPSINDNNDVAFQANTGDLYIVYNLGKGGGGDSGVKMMAGTSPSIDDEDDIAVQGSNGDLWIWIAPATGVASGGHDLGLGMKAGTSPSISMDPGLAGAGRPQTSHIGGPGNDRLNGGSRNDLIYGGRGNDLIRGGPGNDALYGGPGNDALYGGPGNDQIYGGPGNDLIYGGRVTTRSTAARVTIGSSTTAVPRPCSRDREPIWSTSPIAGATIGWCARPVRRTTSLPTGAIGSPAVARATGRPSATYRSGSLRAGAKTFETATALRSS
jgi:Ca2+-binding RTX toxin-like protein